jgi:hypothetical protein
VSTPLSATRAQPVDVEVLRERLIDILSTLGRAMDVAYTAKVLSLTRMATATIRSPGSYNSIATINHLPHAAG